MNDPRPAMISARPPVSRSSVANAWNTRTGSSELSTRDGAREADALGVLARRRERDRRGRHGEVGAVVLADAEDLKADLLGELDLLDQLAQPPLGRDGAPGVGVGRELGEGVDTDLHPAHRPPVRALRLLSSRSRDRTKPVVWERA